MVGLIAVAAVAAFVGVSVYRKKDLSVRVLPRILEIRFKYKDRDKFYATIDFVKRLPGADFIKCGSDSYWTVTKSPAVLNALETWGFPIFWNEHKDTKREKPFNRVEFNKNTPWKNIKVKQDGALYDGKKAWRFQMESLRFLIWNKGRGIIGHEMSVGKTMIALMFLKENWIEHTPALIICTAPIKEQWADEFYYLFGKKLHIIKGRTPHKIPPGTCCVINYDILFYWEKQLQKVGFKTLIPDEFHKCGNMDSQRTRAYRKLGKVIPFLIPLSGTAIRTRPSQFFPTLNLIRPDLFPSLTQFKNRYSKFRINAFTGFREEIKGCRNEAELQNILKFMMFRKERTDKDVEEDTGIKGDRGVRIPVKIKVDTKAYDKQYREVAARLKISSALVKRQIETDLARTAFEAKKTQTIKWIADCLDNGEKLVVFCWHRDVIKYICEAFPKDSVKIDGSVTGAAREKAATAFKGPKNLGVFQAGSMGEGVDWIAKVCRTGAFVELPPSAAEMEQAIMRFDRPGSKFDKMFYYFLLAMGTIDEKRMAELDKGKQAFDKVVRGKVESDSKDLLEDLFKGA